MHTFYMQFPDSLGSWKSATYVLFVGLHFFRDSIWSTTFQQWRLIDMESIKWSYVSNLVVEKYAINVIFFVSSS